jgi:hypothetical protein
MSMVGGPVFAAVKAPVFRLAGAERLLCCGHNVTILFALVTGSRKDDEVDE